MKGVQKIFCLQPKETKELGNAKISCYEYKEDLLYNLRMMRDGGSMFTMTPGNYIRLNVNGELMMSDTRMEKISNQEFINNANGKVMIAGLGIGLIIHNLRDKIESGEITEIVVYEKYQDVIDLVSPFFKDLPITYKTEDILKYKPPKDEIYDTIYFDIWATISTDNLKEIRMLHNRWKFRKNKNNPNVWMNSWMKEFLQQRKREEDKEWY